MKIKKVKWKDHPILWNLELDLTNSHTWEPYSTIIFAWENGTWKSTILETISTFLNGLTFEYFEYIEYTCAWENLKALPFEVPTTGNPENYKDFYEILQEDWNKIQIQTSKTSKNSEMDNNPLNIRYAWCVYSKARADYKTEPIKSTSTENIDTEKNDLDEKEDFTSLKQLLIDIQSQDDRDYASKNRELSSQWNDEIKWEDFYITSKTSRFRESFNNFFEKIKYNKVDDLDGEMNVLFSKNWCDNITIDTLSTGEKQIVFRWAYLLRNINNLKKAVIMIDEPELSMHPKWEQKILKYYQDLFTEDGTQTAQIFVATHSEHVIKEALKNEDETLVIALKEESWNIIQERIDAPSVLNSITSAETNYLAFDIVSNDYHIELYWWLQEKENKHSIKSCDTFIKESSSYNPTVHAKPSTNPKNWTPYETLSTYIRNAIHHPSTNWNFTDDELRISIKLLIQLCE